MGGPVSQYTSSVIVASPALAAETVICAVANAEAPSDSPLFIVSGWAAFTVGTNGTAIRMRMRRGVDTTGTVVGDTGALTGGIAAANLVAQDVQGSDTPGAVAQQPYVLTLQVTGGTAASTVTAVNLAVWASR